MRKAVFRRVITKWAASSLAWAASDRKFRLRSSRSKYSTRHGHQRVSMAAFGNSICSLGKGRPQRTGCMPDVERGFSYLSLADKQRILRHRRRFLGNQLHFRVRQQLKPPARRLVPYNKRVELPLAPFLNRDLLRQKMIAPQIEQHPLLRAADDAILPVLVGNLSTNVPRKANERVSIFAKAANNLPKRITASKQASENQSGRQPPTQISSRPLRILGCRDLRPEQKAQRWNDRKNPIYPLRWNDRHE